MYSQLLRPRWRAAPDAGAVREVPKRAPAVSPPQVREEDGQAAARFQARRERPQGRDHIRSLATQTISKILLHPPPPRLFARRDEQRGAMSSAATHTASDRANFVYFLIIKTQ